jgi:Ankyrin repeats (3 copies)
MSRAFALMPSHQQQDMASLLGTDILPPVRLEKKSLVQLLFDSRDMICADDPLQDSDLAEMDLNVVDDWGVTFLMMACEFGCVDAMRVLVRAGAFINAADKWDNTALHYACGSGYQNCIEELLLAGADWTAVNCEGLGFQTPEVMAIVTGHGPKYAAAFAKMKEQTSRHHRLGAEESHPRISRGPVQPTAPAKPEKSVTVGRAPA